MYDGQWHTVIVTRGGSDTNHMQANYLDGQLISAGEINHDFPAVTAYGRSGSSNCGDDRLLDLPDDLGPLRIYNQVLSQAEMGTIDFTQTCAR